MPIYQLERTGESCGHSAKSPIAPFGHRCHTGNMSSNQAIRPISAESPQALASPGLPEAAGAGSFYPDGSVRFGDQAEPPLRAHIEPRRDPEEVARERAAIPYRCGFCAGIPADLLARLQAELNEARKAARR
jgi:hypothetical protein